MGVLQKYFGTSPFSALAEHTQKVHDCVELLKPLAEAFVVGDHAKIEQLYHEISKTEHEADQVKSEIREQISKVFLLSINRHELLKFVSTQDDIADSAEDFAVILRLRNTSLPPELKDDFQTFVNQVIYVSEQLLGVADDLAILAEVCFEGELAERVLKTIETISEEEWKADELQRTFAEHYYSIEDKLDPTTLVFYDRYCRTLGDVANCAEKCARILRSLIIGR